MTTAVYLMVAGIFGIAGTILAWKLYSAASFSNTRSAPLTSMSSSIFLASQFHQTKVIDGMTAAEVSEAIEAVRVLWYLLNCGDSVPLTCGGDVDRVTVSELAAALNTQMVYEVVRDEIKKMRAPELCEEAYHAE